MPKSEKQKLKLLIIKDLLYEKTDEDHAITTQQIIEELEKRGIKAERKSIYQDIQALEDYGLDIIRKTTRPQGYYLASREFELAELKILVDVVQAARFLTQKKSRELIKKLEALTDRHQAKQLQRQVLVTQRAKSQNENIYYNVDLIHRALAENRQIGFQYFQWTVSKEMKPKKDGTRYLVSPWKLIWDNENYYLIAYDEAAHRVKYYRVDKMLRLSLEEASRNGEEYMADFNAADFSKMTFGMYSGEEKMVTLRLKNALVGVVIDRFGTDVSVRAVRQEEFTVRLEVQVSGQFFGWLAGLGEAAVLEGPEDIRQEYHDYLKRIAERHENR